MANLDQILKEVGLTDNQAKIYLAGLELGPTTILALARKSGVKRTTIYTIIEELIHRGFFTILQKENKKLYIAQDPETLSEMMHQREEIFAKHLPELKSIYNLSPVKPKVMFYEGVENLKRILWQIRKENIPYYHIDPNQQAIRDLIGIEEFDRLIEYSDKYKMDRWVISDRSPFAVERMRTAPPYRKYRFLPKKYHGLLTRQYIWGNKVAIIILKKEPIAVVIEDPDFAKMQKMLFDALWEISEKE
jgi:sugar-specific transcriptional regulator TrmB